MNKLILERYDVENIIILQNECESFDSVSNHTPYLIMTQITYNNLKEWEFIHDYNIAIDNKIEDKAVILL